MPDVIVSEEITVALTERSAKCLRLAADNEGLSVTDTVNRALQVYAYLTHLHGEGYALARVDDYGNAEVLEADQTSQTIRVTFG